MNPLATVVFDVCSVVTVECCVLYPCCVDVFSVMQGRRLFSKVLAFNEMMDMCTERMDMCMHEVFVDVGCYLLI